MALEKHTHSSVSDGALFEVPFIGLPSDARMIADSFESFMSGASLDPGGFMH
jgi:hypothetical protein